MAEATDVVLVGGGIMSATLGVLLKELEPSWEITLIERLEQRRHRAFRVMRTQLRPARRRRHHRPDPRPQYCRTIPHQPPVLVIACRRRQNHRQLLHPYRPAYVAGHEHRPLRLPAKTLRRIQIPKTLRTDGILHRPRQNRRMGAAGHQRP